MEEEKVELKEMEIKILEYLKKVPMASSSLIAFNIQSNYLYAKQYLIHLEKLGYIEKDKDYLKVFKSFTFWRLKNKEKLKDGIN